MVAIILTATTILLAMAGLRYFLFQNLIKKNSIPLQFHIFELYPEEYIYSTTTHYKRKFMKLSNLICVSELVLFVVALVFCLTA